MRNWSRRNRKSPGCENCKIARLDVMGELFRDDLKIVAKVLHGLARAEVENRPAVGFPVIAVEAEDGGAGLEIADGVGRAAEAASMSSDAIVTATNAESSPVVRLRTYDTSSSNVQSVHCGASGLAWAAANWMNFASSRSRWAWNRCLACVRAPLRSQPFAGLARAERQEPRRQRRRSSEATRPTTWIHPPEAIQPQRTAFYCIRYAHRIANRCSFAVPP